MSRFALSTLAAASILGFAAHADHEPGFYVAGFIGAGFPSDAELRGTQNPVPGAPGTAGAPARINAEFDSDIADTDFFGAVQAGDPLPYIPELQALLSLGVDAGRWRAFGSLNYLGESCARASCDAFEEIDSSVIVDLSLQYLWSDDLTLTATVENATDDFEIVGRTPYGARPNKARTAMIGAVLKF